MATIKAIQPSSIHQIQSGQVIVDLNSVVKELVENSLDAGASSIEVRFKDYGLDSIEVQDNGNGIAPDDFDTIALKHYTSKLSSYGDLDSLETFGFRGEALSSLCALSDFHIVTAAAGAGPKGSRLDFETSGRLKGVSVVAAQKGTTVTVEKLFKNLPVRSKELEKNIKREYGKVLNLLQAYACISVNVRFSVSNQPAKGKKTIVFSTKSNPTTKENIVNVYGAKTLLALTKLDLELEMQPSVGPTTQSAKNWSSGSEKKSKQVFIQGHISRPVFGEGRQAPDRQMFFVNSRPCALPQVAKAFNEVYKSFNVSQSPFIFANLLIDTNAYDVNVSPDKRTILLHDQTALLESLKESLTGMFDAHDQTVPTSQLQPKKLPVFKQPTLMKSETTSSSIDDAERATIVSPASPDDAVVVPDETGRKPPGQLISDWVGRDAESRHGTQVGTDSTETVSHDKLKLARALAGQRLNDTSPADSSTYNIQLIDQIIPAAQPLDDDSSATNDILPEVPREVQDFNARIASQKAKKMTTNSRITTETVELPDDQVYEPCDSERADHSDSEGIPAVQPARSKIVTGPVQSAFDRMRPKRHHEEVATVTVGDQTSRMVLGTPEAKKPRIHTPKTSAKAATGPPANFRSSLRAFAAPGTQVADDKPGQLEFDSAMRNEEMAEAAPSSPSIENEQVNGHQLDDDGDETPHSSASAPAYQSPGAGLFVEADDSDDEYLDEDDKKIREDAKVARMIQAAEEATARPTEETLKRATQAFRASTRRRDATLTLEQLLPVSMDDFDHSVHSMTPAGTADQGNDSQPGGDIADENAEQKLSLTISKADFEQMRIVGQFNLGFVLAIRPPSENELPDGQSTRASFEHLFIVDQHAADEKFNFERLYASTTLTAQRLVTPKELQLSAVEQELISNNRESLIANGFDIEVEYPGNHDPEEGMDEDGNDHLWNGDGDDRRPTYRLLTLPTSKETTFSVSDLEELLHLLSETSTSSSSYVHAVSDDELLSQILVPDPSHSLRPSLLPQDSTASLQHKSIVRPTRVRRMLAMRACRSSIMVGKTLTKGQMSKVVQHMGEMDRPWNCPHGRPTMRHLAGLGEWESWKEDVCSTVDWKTYMA